MISSMEELCSICEAARKQDLEVLLHERAEKGHQYYGQLIPDNIRSMLDPDGPNPYPISSVTPYTSPFSAMTTSSYSFVADTKMRARVSGVANNDMVGAMRSGYGYNMPEYYDVTLTDKMKQIIAEKLADPDNPLAGVSVEVQQAMLRCSDHARMLMSMLAMANVSFGDLVDHTNRSFSSSSNTSITPEQADAVYSMLKQILRARPGATEIGADIELIRGLGGYNSVGLRDPASKRIPGTTKLIQAMGYMGLTMEERDSVIEFLNATVAPSDKAISLTIAYSMVTVPAEVTRMLMWLHSVSAVVKVKGVHTPCSQLQLTPDKIVRNLSLLRSGIYDMGLLVNLADLADQRLGAAGIKTIVKTLSGIKKRKEKKK